MVRISLPERLRLLHDLDQGYTQVQAAGRYGISVATVGRLVRSRRLGSSLSPSRPGPRPAVLPEHEAKFGELVAEFGPLMSVHYLIWLYHRAGGGSMTPATLRRHLVRLGLRKGRTERVIVNVNKGLERFLFSTLLHVSVDAPLQPPLREVDPQELARAGWRFGVV